ncbi:MAG: T9SS type A sorting domain-containing protein [Candidatus Symbiothrix sp.]|jgi:hypothetical protein|nr:T9SS type A sorting domain-containing protein [Candidatus Symbiothrix sp.]
MKKLFTSMCVVALATCMGSVAQAQDNPALEGSNYHVIYLDADTEYDYGINEKIVQDLRPTALEEARPLYIWDNTYAAVDATGKGAFGEIGGYLSLTVNNPDWSGIGFCNVKANGATGIDYTTVTDDYHFHLAVKSTTANRAHQIQVFGGIGNDPAKPEEGGGTNATFSVGIGTMDGAENLTPNFKTDGSWSIVDVPVSKLKELGWSNRAGGFFGNYFVVLSGGGNANIGLDGVFFYQPAGTGINNPNANSKLNVLVTKNIVEVLNATAPVEVYSISGVKVKESTETVFGTNELGKGAYIIKSGAAVAKVIIK